MCFRRYATESLPKVQCPRHSLRALLECASGEERYHVNVTCSLTLDRRDLSGGGPSHPPGRESPGPGVHAPPRWEGRGIREHGSLARALGRCFAEVRHKVPLLDTSAHASERRESLGNALLFAALLAG